MLQNHFQSIPRDPEIKKPLLLKKFCSQKYFAFIPDFFFSNVELATTTESKDTTKIMNNENFQLGPNCPQFPVNL